MKERVDDSESDEDDKEGKESEDTEFFKGSSKELLRYGLIFFYKSKDKL